MLQRNQSAAKSAHSKEASMILDTIQLFEVKILTVSPNLRNFRQ